MRKKKQIEDESLPAHVPEDFFSRFKSMGELNGFIDSMFKRGVEYMLKAELTDHLGYDKFDKYGNNSGNNRNGSSYKLIKTSNGELQIEVPRDRNGTFEPIVVPKHKQLVDKIKIFTKFGYIKTVYLVLINCVDNRLSVSRYG